MDIFSIMELDDIEAFRNHLDTVEGRRDINIREGPEGMTPLHLVATSGSNITIGYRRDIVKLLLDADKSGGLNPEDFAILYETLELTYQNASWSFSQKRQPYHNHMTCHQHRHGLFPPLAANQPLLLDEQISHGGLQTG